jgi:uncharacterized protein (TIGR00661 family)
MEKINILYGIQTTGNGHLSRSIEIINKLNSTNLFNIDVLLSGEQNDIELPFPVKYRFDGLKFKINDGISIYNVIKNNNILKLIKDIYYLNLKNYDVIITDFEPITSWSALFKQKKILGIGNHYKFLSKRFSSSINYNLNKVICKIVSPISNYIYFDYFKTEKSCLPIIKKELIEGKGTVEIQKNSVLTYIHSIPWYKQMIDLSKLSDHDFIIYTTDNIIIDKIKIGNITVKKVNPKSFNKDLLKSNAVICNTGFQLTSECLFLGKKLYTIPMKRQIEQEYNSEQLKNIGITTDKEINLEKIKSLLESDFYVEINFDDQSDMIINKILSIK